MSSAPNILSPTISRPTPPPVTWRTWPLAEGGLTLWSGALVVIVSSAIVQGLTDDWRLAALAAAAILLAGWRYCLPATYELNALGITQEVFGRRRRIAWTAVDRAEILQRGVLLSTEHPAAGSRGVLYLPWEKRREEVLSHVRYYLARIIEQDE